MTPLKKGFGDLPSYTEALETLLSHVSSVATEKVAVEEAGGRVLATDVASAIDVPHFAKSAMDGYAVIASDTAGASNGSPVTLRLIGRATPGELLANKVTAGTCAEISTGAPIPAGADSVVMVEITELHGSDSVLIKGAVSKGDNVVPIASDISAGDVVVRKGVIIRPRHLGALAATGIAEVEVAVRPKVALITTGPELLPLGEDLVPGRIFDINSHTLAAAIEDEGAQAIDYGVIPDDREIVAKAIGAAADECDFVVVSGGSSLGAGDIVIDAVRDLGGEVPVHGVKVKPGKPLMVAIVHDCIVIGLPGNPVSALSDYNIFMRHALHKAMGVTGSIEGTTRVRLSADYRSPKGRHEFCFVRIAGGEAVPVGKGSSAITGLAEADGFFEIDEDAELVEAGTEVLVHLF